MSLSNGAFVGSFVDLSVHLFAHLLLDCLSVQLLVRSLVQNIVASQRRSVAPFSNRKLYIMGVYEYLKFGLFIFGA